MRFFIPLRKNLSIHRISGFFWGCVFLISSLASADQLQKPIECLVCDKSHSNADFPISYKGREIMLCSDGCHEHYLHASNNNLLDSITAKIEPRSALFQADSHSDFGSNRLTFGIGYYILFGLVCGGAAAYMAVQKGNAGWPAFLIGLVANVFGILFAGLQSSRPRQFSSQGLSKVPVTYDEDLCAKCGHANHPSAKKCTGCASELNATIKSEVLMADIDKS